MPRMRIEELRRRMKEAGLNQLRLARAAGLNDTYVRDVLSGRSKNPGIEGLQRLAAALNCEITDLTQGGDAELDKSQTNHRSYVINASNISGSQPARMPHAVHLSRISAIDPVPVLGTGSCGEDGRFEMNGQVVDYQPRPERLRGIADAYAIFASGSSMEPRYLPGEVLFVHPGKPVTPLCFVVVQLRPKDDGDVIQGFVKQYIRRDNDKLVLREFSPVERDIVIPMSDVLSVHRIVQSGEAT